MARWKRRMKRSIAFSCCMRCSRMRRECGIISNIGRSQRRYVNSLPPPVDCLAAVPLTRGGDGLACHCGVGQKPSGRLGHGSHVYTGQNGRCSDDWDSATEERYGYRGQNSGFGFEQLCVSSGAIDYRWVVSQIWRRGWRIGAFGSSL